MRQMGIKLKVGPLTVRRYTGGANEDEASNCGKRGSSWLPARSHGGVGGIGWYLVPHSNTGCSNEVLPLSVPYDRGVEPVGGEGFRTS